MRASDLEIVSLNHHPKGGQQVGLIGCGVRVTHTPTGISASCETERSQFRNLRVAKSMIEWGLAEIGWKDASR